MVINIPNKTALFNPLSGHLEQLFGYIDSSQYRRSLLRGQA